MPLVAQRLAAPGTDVAHHGASEIFSQEDRKIGRFLGFTLRTETFGATPAPRGRCEGVRFDDCSNEVIGACIDVHRELGPGLLEGMYEECLCRELTMRGLRFERQKPIIVSYKGAQLEQGYRVDLIVEGSLLVEIKSVEALLRIHAAQVITYLRVTGLEHGLLVNFNTLAIRDGLRRLSRTHPSFRSSDLPVRKSRPS
jgi:GxxExxY protein